MVAPVPAVEITRLASCGGCAAKVGPGELRRIVGGLGRAGADPNLLVGTETGDDAAVYRLREDLAVVVTTDFIPPVCNDPHLYGQIAAANALSDVFAMGGLPVAAVAICAFPDPLPPEVASEIIAGGAAKAAEAGAVVAGGHTVRNPELLYGLAVTGHIHPGRIVRNAGARVGDALVLTKPLGAGLAVNGARNGKLSADELIAVCRVMATLNREASAVMLEHGAHAATDVTGFGLAGHGLGMARGSGASLRFRAQALPLYPPALRLARDGVSTRGTRANRETYGASVDVAGELAPELAALLYDPQTSGGLLIAVDGDRADACLAALRSRGVAHAALVGEVVPADGEPRVSLVA